MTPEERYEQNENLVYFTLNRFFAYIAQDKDWQQVGKIALWKACRLFDDTHGASFSTYAVACIRGAIQHKLQREMKRRQFDSNRISLSTAMFDDGDMTLENCIPGDCSAIEDFERQEAARQLINAIYGVTSDEQRRTLNALKRNDFVIVKTAEELGITYQAVKFRLKKIKRDVEERLGTDEYHGIH